MIRPYRKRVRDAVREILADDVAGFNARHAELAAAYGIEALTIDFAPGSTSFFQGALAQESSDFDFSQVLPKPIALVLYTAGAVNTKDQNSGFWSGQVEARMDFYLQFRDRIRPGVDMIERDDCETIGDAVEEAALQALHDDAAAWGDVVYNFDVRTERGDLKLTGDGWQQRISILIVCGVHV